MDRGQVEDRGTWWTLRQRSEPAQTCMHVHHTCTRGGLEEETAAHIVSVHYEDIS